MNEKRCCIYIDIEGFGNRWKNGESLHSLNDLMLAIYRIGTYSYPNEVERIFAHQFGDAFAIISDLEEKNLSRFISIAVILMQYVLSKGGMVRCSIAEGDWSDIQGCYPSEITDPIKDNKSPMGAGIMTLYASDGFSFN